MLITRKYKHSTKFENGDMSVFFITSSVEKPLNPLHAAKDCVRDFEHICFGSEVQNILVRRGWKLKRKWKQSQFHYTHTMSSAVNVRQIVFYFCCQPEAQCSHSIPVYRGSHNLMFDLHAIHVLCNKFHRNLYRRDGIHLTTCSNKVCCEEVKDWRKESARYEYD